MTARVPWACAPLRLRPPTSWAVAEARRWGAIALDSARTASEALEGFPDDARQVVGGYLRHARTYYTGAARAVLSARGLGRRLGVTR